MIGTIRNPWIRRPLVVLAGVTVIPFVWTCLMLAAALEGQEEANRECIAAFGRAWRGPPRA